MEKCKKLNDCNGRCNRPCGAFVPADPEYPMLDKIEKLQGESNLCSEFLDFIRSKYVIFDPRIPGERPGYIGAGDYINPEKLLAEFLGIDLEQAEDERQKILKSLHPLNEDLTAGAGKENYDSRTNRT